MEQTAVFTITEIDNGFSIGGALNVTSKRFNTYNKYNVRKADLFDVMCELADVFNNVIGMGIQFVVE